MSDLRNKIIRLAHAKPELRDQLLPLITKSARGTSWVDVSTGWFVALGKAIVKKSKTKITIKDSSHTSLTLTVQGNPADVWVKHRNYQLDFSYTGYYADKSFSQASSLEGIASAIANYIDNPMARSAANTKTARMKDYDWHKIGKFLAKWGYKSADNVYVGRDYVELSFGSYSYRIYDNGGEVNVQKVENIGNGSLPYFSTFHRGGKIGDMTMAYRLAMFLKGGRIDYKRDFDNK